MKKKSIDLSKLNQPRNNLLVKKPADTQEVKPEPKKNIDKKIGRPFTGDEPLNKKVTINFSESEIRKITEVANGIPLSSYIRRLIKNSLLR